MGSDSSPPSIHLASNLLLHYAVMAGIMGAAFATCALTGDLGALQSATGLA